jgi:hypothetical protein
MSLKSKQELLEALHVAYSQASWMEKTQILDGFIAATGYCRKYAIILLNSEMSSKARKRVRAPIYGESVREALTTIWLAANRICAKRLVPFLPEMLSTLERTGHLVLEQKVRDQLLELSASTADRLLKPAKQRLGRSRSYTRKGHWLRSEIAVQTFSDWSDKRTGFFEADLVSHNGGNPRGQCLHTLTITDIATGWTELLALRGKTELAVLDGLRIAMRKLPMPLLGLDTDNGGEFINHSLAQFCRRQGITFTRSREYKKNDQAHVEEKNGSIVRRLIGHNRYDTDEAHETMVSFYRLSRLYINFFQPSLKLESKVKLGSKTKKKYDRAKTPARRFLELSSDPESKLKVERLMFTLDPVCLLQKMEALQNHLHSLTAEAPSIPDLKPSPIVLPGPKQIVQMPAQVMPLKRKSGRKTGSFSLVKVSADISKQLELEPSLSAKELLDRLIRCHPGVYDMQQLSQMHRLVRDWRLAHPEHLDRFPPQVRFALKFHFKRCGILP